MKTISSVQRTPLQEIAKQAVETIRRNEMADRIRYAGKYTGNGLEQATKDAEANTADRMMMKGILANLGLVSQ